MQRRAIASSKISIPSFAGWPRGAWRARDRTTRWRTSALIHEAYLRLARSSAPRCRDRSHFLAIAAITMRRVLVDHARRRTEPKRGGRAVRVRLYEADRTEAAVEPEVLALDQALERLAERSPAAARVVELRCFGGLTVAEIAGVLGVSAPTVRRRWRTARAWLHAALADGKEGDPVG